ncbi:hypothetical protein UC77_03675 [Clostridium baratii]|uniref:Uncharacterized protein n=1 Tax=Clostridium nitritogenes TaxID=83340 RepID=A0ABN1LUG5_9CLOT|nr:hypothetical protein UC77_03675 [Clostridium baratii]
MDKKLNIYKKNIVLLITIKCKNDFSKGINYKGIFSKSFVTYFEFILRVWTGLIKKYIEKPRNSLGLCKIFLENKYKYK